jgi:hypothetical protein
MEFRNVDTVRLGGGKIVAGFFNDPIQIPYVPRSKSHVHIPSLKSFSKESVQVRGSV